MNRTVRNADGSALSDTVYSRNILHAEARTYDDGIWKSGEYAGETILTLGEFLLSCRNIGLPLRIEIKTNVTTSELQIFFVKFSNMA